jgi:hypothetical protein
VVGRLPATGADELGNSPRIEMARLLMVLSPTFAGLRQR